MVVHYLPGDESVESSAEPLDILSLLVPTTLTTSMTDIRKSLSPDPAGPMSGHKTMP